MKHKMVWLAGVCAVGVLAFGLAWAGLEKKPETLPAPEEESEALPAEVNDASFERFIDVSALRAALVEGDAAGLADAAFLLAEGERVLRRPHKGFTSAKVYALAVKAAADKKDLATLDRLEKGATDEQKAMVGTARKLAKGSRAAPPKVSLDEVDEKAAAAIREYKEAIDAAALVEDREALGEIAASLKESKLSANVKGHLEKLAAEAVTGLPEKSDAEAEALRKLAGTSRNFFKKVVGVSKYDVSIYNESGLTFNYTIEGQRFAMTGKGGGYRHKGEKKGKAEVVFRPASGGSVTQAVDSGKTYVFRKHGKGVWLYQK